MASTSNINLATFRINIDTSELHDDEDDDELQINTNPAVPSAFGIPLKYISYVLKLPHLPVFTSDIDKSYHLSHPKFPFNDHHALFARVNT
jgi:hypothetical protein